ncbi:hypothetical protein GCM10027589_39560 [Actinocorallia lasiicapitis]
MFLSLLAPDLQKEVRIAGTCVRWRRGQHLMRQGTRLDAVRVIEAGWVKVWAVQDGQERILDLLGPTYVLGELELFDPRVQWCWITALTEVQATTIAPERFDALMRTRPEITRAVLESTVEKFWDEHALRMCQSGTQRLKVLLSRLADRHGELLLDGRVRVSVPLSRATLAGWARINPSLAGRILRERLGDDLEFTAGGLLLRPAALDRLE